MCKHCDNLIARVPGAKDLAVVEGDAAGVEVRDPTTAELLVATALRFDEKSEIRGVLMTTANVVMEGEARRRQGLEWMERHLGAARMAARMAEEMVIVDGAALDAEVMDEIAALVGEMVRAERSSAN